jgi:hypothetical protein
MENEQDWDNITNSNASNSFQSTEFLVQRSGNVHIFAYCSPGVRPVSQRRCRLTRICPGDRFRFGTSSSSGRERLHAKLVPQGCCRSRSRQSAGENFSSPLVALLLPSENHPVAGFIPLAFKTQSPSLPRCVLRKSKVRTQKRYESCALRPLGLSQVIEVQRDLTRRQRLQNGCSTPRWKASLR